MRIVLEVAIKHRLDYLVRKLVRGRKLPKIEAKELDLLAKLEKLYQE